MNTTKSSNDFTSLMYAFALGSLDKEEYEKMLGYIEGGGDFMWQELGEYQNLSSLLVSFLDIENPDIRVKDQIARKLYRLKEQKRPTKSVEPVKTEIPKEPVIEEPVASVEEEPVLITEENIQPEEVAETLKEEQKASEETPQPPEEEFSLVSASLSRSLGARKQDTQINMRKDLEKEQKEVEEKPAAFKNTLPEGFEAVESVSIEELDKAEAEKVIEEEKQPEAEIIESVPEEPENIDLATLEPVEEPKEDIEAKSLEDYLKKYEVQPEPEIIPEPEKKPEPIPVPVQTPVQPVVVKGGVSFVTILVLFLLLGAGIIAVYYMLSKQIKETTEQSASLLKQDISTIKESIADDKTISSILNSNSLLLVNLTGTEKNAGATGKIFIDQASGTGIIQLSNLPKLQANKVYKLWFKYGEIFTMVDMPADVVAGKYYNLSGLPKPEDSSVLSVYITEEPLEGAGRISNRIYFTGTVNLK
jgi:hypothetical protein